MSLSELMNKMEKTFSKQTFSGLQQRVKEQFLYILPTYFEVTEQTRRLAALPGDGPGGRHRHARALVACADPESRRDIDVTDLQMNYKKEDRYLRALHFYGLDIRDGWTRFNAILFTAMKHNIPIMNLEIIVLWPERAKRYVNLGTKVILETGMLKEPATLNAALADYELINRLVSTKDRYLRASWEHIWQYDKHIYQWIKMRNAFRQYVLQLHENQVVDRIISHHAKLLEAKRLNA